MENPHNPMMITVLVRFRGRISYDYLMVIMQELIRRYRRFRQRIVIPSGVFPRPYWADDPDLRLENHIEVADLPVPISEDSLVEMTNKVMNTPLDFAHPLWKITFVDNHPEGSIAYIRVHHCIADGISLMNVLLQITKVDAQGKYIQVPATGQVQNSIVTPTMEQAVENSDPPAEKEKGSRNLAFRTPNKSDILRATVRILIRPSDPKTILKGPLGPTKKAVWSEPFSVPEIRKIARFRSATINDVMMAVTSGASRRYMELHHDDRVHNVRAFILVNMRGRIIDDELGNNFGLVFLTMPVEKNKPLDRLDAIKQGMDSLKASAEYAATYMILKILGQLPKWIEDIAIRILDSKGTVVATNVPGSRQELSLAGAPIQTLVAWVPQSGRIGMGLSFISYNNQLVVGLNTDARSIPDPEVFLQLFTEEYKSLQSSVAELK